jgi:hypothetical protein
MQTSTANFLESATALRDRFHIIPIQPGQKIPFPAAGVLSASNDPEQIATWAAQWPNANIAIAGSHASGIAILESDDFERL